MASRSEQLGRMVNASESPRYGEITLRSLIAGVIACSAVAIWATESAWIVGASRLNLSQLPVATFGLFFAVVLVNMLLTRLAPRAAFTRAEVMVVFVTSFIAANMATAALLDWVISVVTAPYYFATPENRWIEDVWPHLRRWAVIEGPSDKLRWAYFGIPLHTAIPWDIWIIPMFWWGSFVGAVALVSICLAAIFRKQWADHERLPFPLAQIPLEVMSDPGGAWNIPALLRKKAFWIGFAIPMFVVCFNMLSYFATAFPRIPINDEFNIMLSRQFTFANLVIKLNWYTLGFAYMVNTNILFSVWVWHLLALVETSLFSAVGYTLGPTRDAFSSWDAIQNWQGFGAFIVFVLWGLWMGQGHLKHVFLSFLGKVPADDERELVPFRWAVPGLFVSTLYIALFLRELGMTWAMILAWLFAAFIAYFGTTRMIAQTGLVYMRSPMTPPLFVLGALGTVGVPPEGLVGMVGTYSLVANGRAPLMPGIFHVSWIAAKLGEKGRRMFAAVIISLICAYIVGAVYVIYTAYMQGASTFLGVSFRTRGEYLYNGIIQEMQARVPVDTGRLSFLGIGAAVMVMLTALQYRFPGFPLHPIGFPIAATFHVRFALLPVFLAWAIKSVLLHVGGVEAYQRSRPIFIGIIAGYSLAIMISFGVDWLWFNGAGHQVHSW